MEKAREQKAVNDITNVGVSLMSAIRLRISIGDSVQSIPSSRHICLYTLEWIIMTMKMEWEKKWQTSADDKVGLPIGPVHWSAPSRSLLLRISVKDFVARTHRAMKRAASKKTKSFDLKNKKFFYNSSFIFASRFCIHHFMAVDFDTALVSSLYRERSSAGG